MIGVVAMIAIAFGAVVLAARFLPREPAKRGDERGVDGGFEMGVAGDDSCGSSGGDCDGGGGGGD